MNCHRSITRRNFLKGAATASAAVATAYLVPSGVLAAPGRPGANDRIGIGGIGVGRQGGAVVRAAAHAKDARIVAVADVNLPRARELAAAMKAEPYQDYRKLLERKDVDAIITATPEHWRALVCIHACQAGKDIYAEKPHEPDHSRGAADGRSAVRKHRRVFQTGSQQRSMAANRFGCELVRNGRIGKIKKSSPSITPARGSAPAGAARARWTRLGDVVRSRRRWFPITSICTRRGPDQAGSPSAATPAAK